ncbi:MAG: L-lactate dehydrogenase [Lachnospiraceae bacterium]|nr:L-lactate dehydrogenase [Lachnospiraceae bacterium]
MKNKVHYVDSRKVAVIGCGFVGSTIAFALMQSGLFSDMVLIDVDKKKAEGEALDIGHGILYARPMKIWAGDYEDIADAAIVIITAGANQKPGETRLDLVHKNISILRSIMPEVTKYNKTGIILMVANPVDILTYAALKISGLPENRVFGSGTVLDTARLKYEMGELLEVDSRGVHAFIVGEHGDSEIAAWSSANVSGVPLKEFCKIRSDIDTDRLLKETTEEVSERVKNSAYEIIERKQATYYGIAMAVKRICETIVRDEKSVLPVSSMMHGEYGLTDVVLSMPAIVGENGVEHVVPVSLNEEEQKRLWNSAQVLKEIQKKEGL